MHTICIPTLAFQSLVVRIFALPEGGAACGLKGLPPQIEWRMVGYTARGYRAKVLWLGTTLSAPCRSL